MPTHENLATALAAFQAELPRLRKDETAKVKGESASGQPVNYTYGYADLAQVSEAVGTCLGKHGLAFTAWPTMTEKGFLLTYSLLHEGGEERTGIWPLPDPTRTKPQQLGSAITYARRYAIMAVTGTFPDKEDDDGAAAVPTSHDEWASARPAQPRPQADRQAQAGQEPQADPAPPAPKTSWTDAEVAEIQSKMVTASLDKIIGAYDWMAGKGLHNRAVGQAGTTGTTVLAMRLAEGALKADATPEQIESLKSLAEARGLLKVQVSETETLDQVIHDARELAVHEAVTQAKADTPDPATA